MEKINNLSASEKKNESVHSPEQFKEKIKQQKYNPAIINEIIGLDEKNFSKADRNSLLEYYADTKYLKFLDDIFKQSVFKTYDLNKREEDKNRIKETIDYIFSKEKEITNHPGLIKFLCHTIQDSVISSKEDIEKIVEFAAKLAESFVDDPKYAEIFWRILDEESVYSMEKLVEILFCKTNEGLKDRESLFLAVVDHFGVELIRKTINKMIAENKYEDIEGLKYARSLIMPSQDKNTIEIENLKNFYQNQIRFEKYKLNELMNNEEVDLLKTLVDKKEKILEQGCGTGRLILEMKKSGYDITGMDFVERHIDEIKKQDLKADVFKGDWHYKGSGIEDNQFDVVYSLGRNILHNESLPEQVEIFWEANRILKKGGKFIFDIPNREKGLYKMMIDEYASEMKKRKCDFRFGTIYDSPDGVHFATRYAYSEDDIKQLASLSSFKIIKKEVRDLETGKGDENWYYVLEKV